MTMHDILFVDTTKMLVDTVSPVVIMYYCESQEQLANSNKKAVSEYHVLEDGDYWEPSNDVNELYRQLCLKKYREIVPQQLVYVSS